MSQTRVAILASGSGSTAEAFIREIHARRYPLTVTLILANNPDAYVLERAKSLNAELGLDIKTAIVNGRTQAAKKSATRGQQTEEEQVAILALLEQYDIDLVLLLGYMKRVGELLVHKYGWQPGYTSVYQARMLNTHPGLLPHTLGTHGRDTQKFTLEEGMTESGQTLHVVASAYDTGPHVAEHRVVVLADDTPASLFARVQAVEKEYIAADVAGFVRAQEQYRGILQDDVACQFEETITKGGEAMATVLIIGSGGREHALAWGVAQSPRVERVYVSPGNAGTAGEEKCENVAVSGNESTVQFCQTHGIDLVVIGPEAPLIAGLSDALRAAGITVFGASQAAARLEGSKAYATKFMQKHGIPLPSSRVVHSAEEATVAITAYGGPKKSVIKADGLAGGKGVFLPDNEVEATEALAKIASGGVDGDGSICVIQQRNHGPEVSVFVLSDGEHYQIIPLASQDHKRLLEGDKGPNTGGMGVYGPLPEWMLSSEQWDKIATISQKSIEGMAADGTPYHGVLYIGLMLAEELDGDPLVIEYNARFGDPETEVIIPLLHDNGVDIYEMLYATATGKIADFPLPTELNAAALTICLAAAGYPDAPVPGEIISGLDENYRDVTIFHGGTKLNKSGETVSSGGRVLYITGLGVNLAAASEAARAAIGDTAVRFPGMQYRPDIAWRAQKT